MIKVGAVSYLNTKPLIYGFEEGRMKEEIELIIDYPSRIAQLLFEDQIDLGLIPVSVIPSLEKSYVISDYCIGCNGAVASVCIFSEVPIDKIQRLLLDYQSRTSVALTRILTKKHWHIDPLLIDTTEDFREQITGTTAGLIIGDRAFEQRRVSPYVYDLGLAWKEFTGMPFVFAAWTSNKKLEDGFIQSFNEANKLGIDHLDDVVAKNPYSLFDLKEYYNKHISYYLDQDKMAGMKYFLSELRFIG